MHMAQITCPKLENQPLKPLFDLTSIGAVRTPHLERLVQKTPDVSYRIELRKLYALLNVTKALLDHTLILKIPDHSSHIRQIQPRRGSRCRSLSRLRGRFHWSCAG